MPSHYREAADLDTVFGLLGHSYRRRILDALSQPQDDEETADVLALILPTETREVVELSLYHTHLPKLAEAGYIEWDMESFHVRRGPQFGEIAPVLALIHDQLDDSPIGFP